MMRATPTAVVSRSRLGRPGNDFTNRNTTFMTWNLLHVARMLQGRGRNPGARATSGPSRTPAAASTSTTPTIADQARAGRQVVPASRRP
jgi:hypothetical protein